MAAASKSKTSMNHTSKITECSICLCTFTKPKSLPCIHAFCLHCLTTLTNNKKTGNQMPCPMCRQPFIIPLAGIAAIPNNLFIEHILETESLLDKKIQGQEVVCDLCGDDEANSTSATGYCIECHQNFCVKCSGRHQKLQFAKNHNIVMLKEKGKSHSLTKLHISYCTTHKDEQLKLFCYNCKQTVCLMCFAVGHNGHKCSDINASAKEFSKHLNEAIDKMKQIIVATKNELSTAVIDKAQHLKQKLLIQLAVSEHCNELKAFIDSEQKRIEQELSSSKDTRLKQIETRRVDLSSKLATMQSFVQYSKELLEKGSACDVSRTANELIERSGQLFREQTAFNSIKLFKYEMKFVPACAPDKSVMFGAMMINDESLGLVAIEDFQRSSRDSRHDVRDFERSSWVEEGYED